LSSQSDTSDTLQNLRVHPELSLDYPQSSISWIRERESTNGKPQGYEIETTFFGLYGVSSPLPGFYTEELFDDDWDEQQAARGFLDIIHYRLYPLLYQAWQKYRFNVNAIEQNKAEYWEILYSLVGLSREFRDALPSPGQLLKYAGILSHHPKSQLGLQTILNDLLPAVPVRIEPCIKRKVRIIERQRCHLGASNCRLGENAMVGKQVEDRSGKFNIEIGPLDQQAFNRISSDAATIDSIRAITRLFLVKPLLFDIVLILGRDNEQQTCLGNENSAILGKNTWMGDAAEGAEYRLVLN